ncbi:RICIN domain-containing protein [Streptomyces sp. PsTaAH-124]|uniref:RICIN domain-containing protein n=1 Tax=Streptomyces sp. PsTaAH-124 TaxID=1157638 RepID=UPI00037BFF8C|nr:RICIN domain-containing protein [Streptomyces sp. PsTaAH-124]
MNAQDPTSGRRLRRAVVVLALAACLSTGVAGVASADAPARDGSRTVSAGAVSAAAVEHYGNMATGGCLDDSEHGFRGYQCNNSNYQNWSVRIWQGDGTRQFRNVFTGRCMYGGVGAGARPETRACDSSEQQSWWVHARGDQVSFENQATGLCLDDSEYGLRMMVCTYNRYQTWR